MQTCAGLGQLPRGRQQIKDLKRKTDNNSGFGFKNISGSGKTNDPWYCLLKECKMQARSKDTAFIRDVRVSPEPLCLLASERQLNDLKRFCCDVNLFKPLTVDPTFDIGEFNVTPISYENLLLETKHGDQYPTIIGPVLVHEKKTKETYSLFCGALKTLKPDLKDLLAYGTDDEEALSSAFTENFERTTHLLCSNHLRKNVECRLVELDIKGKEKEDVLADIFGRQVGEVYERGLCDAESPESFRSQMGVLKEKWLKIKTKGLQFYQWFAKNKEEKFLYHVIAPVRQRAGLGCPPTKFTTNRSERTNGVIQDHIKRQFGQRPVDVFSFAVALKDLIDMQENEIELSLLGKGEFSLRSPYKYLQVNSPKWIRMTEKQKKQALAKIHSINVDDTVETRESRITTAALNETDPILHQFLQAAIDWIPRDVLAFKTKKAAEIHSSGAIVQLNSNEATITLVVPSKDNPKQPHIVNIYPSGKCECDQNCPGYVAVSICAHVIAACLKTSRLSNFIQWFVTKKRKSGGINYSRAVSFGMPRGRGRKGEAPPRKRKKRSEPTVSVDRNSSMQHHSTTTVQPNLCSSETSSSFSPAGHTSSLQFSTPCSPCPLPIRPQYPSPAANTFIVYSLHFCPPLTSVCFGCGKSLKPSGLISDPPGDLVIVSFMQRQFRYGGEVHTRPGNVYFHCMTTCVRQKQPAFDPRCHCTVPHEILRILTPVHVDYIERCIGISL